MAIVLSANIGSARSSQNTDVGVTGIDKRSVDEPVEVRAPGSKRTGWAAAWSAMPSVTAATTAATTRGVYTSSERPR